MNPLFGQVAVATVRNVLFTSVAKLQRVDELLSDKVAELRAMQAKQAKLQDSKLMQKDPDVDCAQQSDGLEVVNGLRVMLRDEELQHRKE